MWVLDYIEDLQSDFMVFYKIRNIYKIDGATFMQLAERVGAYSGVIRAKAEVEAQEQSERKGRSRGHSRGGPNRDVATPSANELASMGLADIG